MCARPRIDRVLPGHGARPKADSTLNLADLDPAVWHILSRDQAHGPFTLGQMQAFADAGKIGPLTRISAGNGESFLPALDHAPLRGRIEAAMEARAARRAEASNYVIVSGEGGVPSLAVRAALSAFGQLTEPLPGTFILRSDQPFSDVRRALAAAAPEAAQYLIFESREARLGWSGLPPVAAASIRAVWDAPLNPLTD